MKKLLTIAVLAGAASSYGQGFVSWGNTTGTRVSLSTGGGVLPSTSNSFIYALFSAPSTTTAIGVGPIGDPTTSGWTFTGDYATNTAAGRLLAISSQPDGAGIQIPGYAPGTTASFAVVGWSANLGTTWAQVQAQVDSGFAGLPGYYGVDQSVATDFVLAPTLHDRPGWFGCCPAGVPPPQVIEA